MLKPVTACIDCLGESILRKTAVKEKLPISNQSGAKQKSRGSHLGKRAAELLSSPLAESQVQTVSTSRYNVCESTCTVQVYVLTITARSLAAARHQHVAISAHKSDAPSPRRVPLGRLPGGLQLSTDRLLQGTAEATTEDGRQEISKVADARGHRRNYHECPHENDTDRCCRR